jgi:hypothetical protein
VLDKAEFEGSRYNDATTIPLNNTYTSGSVSTVWQGLTTGAYAIYDNELSTHLNVPNYGFHTTCMLRLIQENCAPLAGMFLLMRNGQY